MGKIKMILKWIKYKLPWMSKTEHRQKMVQLLQSHHEQQKKTTKMWKDTMKYNGEIYELTISLLQAKIEELEQRLEYIP